MQDDAALLEGLRAGDERAFQTLIDRYHASLRRTALTIVRSASAADDVVQETWLGVLKGIDRFEGRASLKTWIFRILVNRARSRALRDGRTLPFSALTDDEDDEPAVDPDAFRANGHWLHGPARLDSDPEGHLLATELRELMSEIVDELPPSQRAVITLRDVIGLDAADVCEMLELTEGNQRVLLHRARTRVRRALAGYVEQMA